MKRNNVAGLAVINIALLLLLGVLSFTPPAQGQIGGGNYIMIAGKTTGQDTRPIYVIELTRGLMIAAQFNQGALRIVGQRNISNDVQ